MTAQEQKWMEEQLELRREQIMVRMTGIEEEYRRTRAQLTTEREQELRLTWKHGPDNG
jgi:hypothetical protein